MDACQDCIITARILSAAASSLHNAPQLHLGKKSDRWGAASGKELPTGKIAVHGSALYRPEASDIDVAILVTAAEFEIALTNTFAKEIKELRALGEDPMKITVASAHNARQRTFANAVESGKITRDRVTPPLSKVRDDIRDAIGRKTDLSLVKEGGSFDRGPYMVFP